VQTHIACDMISMKWNQKQNADNSIEGRLHYDAIEQTQNQQRNQTNSKLATETNKHWAQFDYSFANYEEITGLNW